MSQQTIELSGIVRNLPDKTVKDGMMQELINLRPRDGALRTVGIKARGISTPTDVRYIHTISEELKIYVGSSGDYLAYWIYNDGELQSSTVTAIAKSSSMQFASLKNSLMISDNTAEKTYILLYDGQSNSYKEFTTELPEIPYVTFKSEHITADDQNDTEDSSIDSDWDDARMANYVKIQKSKAEDGYLTGIVLLRCAWELFDGTIIKHTLPDQMPSSNLVITGTAVGEYYKISRSFLANDLQIKLNISSGDLATLQENYKNIIKSLKIYVTLPRSPEVIYTGEKATVKQTNPVLVGLEYARKALGLRPSSYNVTYDVSHLTTDIPDMKDAMFYLLKEFKLSELQPGTFVSMKNDTVQDLATREIMPVDNLTHHSIYGERLFPYNDRIFLGKIKNKLYQGPDINGVITEPSGGSTGDPYDVSIEYDILTEDKSILTVFSGWETFNYYNVPGSRITFGLNHNNLKELNSYWGYPDSRAITARVFIRQGGVIKLSLTKQLESYQSLNFSASRGEELSVTFSLLPAGTLKTVTTSYYDDNRVQATEINNPFYFPAINSYRIGFGKILGMSTNAIALSQGQFGQFPIFCFTTDGIWTMNIGSGENLINTITPLSRHVCNNPESITPIDGGTAFTTNKGLFIISGTQVIEISDLVNGTHNSRITGTVNYEAIANNPNLYEIKSFLCSVPFLTYISGAKIAWDHSEDHKELIISNSTYNYSWVYNLKHKLWFKISQAWESFVTDYPRTFGYKTVDATYYQDDLSEEDFSEYIPVHLETRPLKLSRSLFKMLNRLLVQGYLSEPEKPFSVNLFGSTNNITWHLMNNGKLFSNGYLPLLLGRTTFSCQYFILVLGGEVDEDFYLTHVDVDFDERYGNKLR